MTKDTIKQALEAAYNRAKFSRSVNRNDFEAGWNAALSAEQQEEETAIRILKNNIQRATIAAPSDAQPQEQPKRPENDAKLIEWLFYDLEYGIDVSTSPTHAEYAKIRLQKYRNWLAAPVTVQPANDNKEWIYELYNYLDSTLPDGAADEAFRVAPEAVREAIATLQAGSGNVAGIGLGHSPQVGRTGVAETVQPASKPEVIELAEKWERLAEKFYAAGTDISIAEGAQMKNCAKDLRALTRCATSKEASELQASSMDYGGGPFYGVEEASEPARDDVLRIVVQAHCADLEACIPTLHEHGLKATADEVSKAVSELREALQSHPAQAGKEASEAAQINGKYMYGINGEQIPVGRALRTQPAEPVQAVTLTDAPFKLVDIISTGYEGWANLIYTGPEWKGGCIAMCHPPVADAFRRLLAGSAKGEAE